MVAWLKRTLIQAPRNGTTAHTVTFPAPGAGNLLVVVVEGAVTSTTPAGFTLPAGGSAVNNTGLYVWWKVAAGGESSFATTHNASNYPVAFVVYEFPAGSAFVKSVAAVGVARPAANPNLTGLAGTNLVAGVKAAAIPEGAFYSGAVWSGPGAPVQDVDAFDPGPVTDGYALSVAVVEELTATAWAPTGLVDSDQGSWEALTFAVKVATGGGGNPGALTAVVPRLKGSIVGQSVNAGTLAGKAPKLRAALTAQSVNSGTLNATVPRVTGSVAAASSNAGILNVTVAKATASVTGASVNVGTLNAATPLVTSQIADVVTNHGTLNGTVPRLTGALHGASVNAGTLNATAPKVVAALTGQETNPGTLAASVPRVTAQISDTTSNVGILAASVPTVTAGISGASVNRGSLNATMPVVAAVLVGELVNGGTLTATTPPITGSITGALVNIGVLAGILPRLIMTKHVPPPIPDIRRLTGARITRTLTGMTNTRALVGHAPTRSLKGAP